MQSKLRCLFSAWGGATFLWLGANVSGLTANPTYHYELIEGSSLVDDCHFCGRPAIYTALRGGFDLVLEEENPLFATYAVTNIDFHAGFAPNWQYVVSGHGTFRIGGEVALQQSMILEMRINDQLVVATNETALVNRPWPMLAVALNQQNDTNLQFFTLGLAAAPMREFWFSTTAGFTPADFNRPRGSAGDILSSSGRVVTPNGELLAHLGFMPPVAEMAVDALDVAPGGAIAFSLDETAFSETIGSLQHGDILSAQGERLYLNQQLLEPFGLVFDALDLGLDALHITDDGEVLFSITKDMESPNAGLLHRGDLLSNKGVKFRTFDQLTARFAPPKGEDPGLDAVYVWPSGEVWFSVETSFQDDRLGPILQGDLLSDQGYVVARNLDILAPFQPVEDLADFGLDGLFVITDVSRPAAAPQLEISRSGRDDPSITVRWKGAGRVFQLEQSVRVRGPWYSYSEILPAQELIISKLEKEIYFRLKQW